MSRYSVNDIVKVVKTGDKYYGEQATIVDVCELIHAPVTIYTLKFEDGTKKYYFFGELYK